MSCWAAPFRVPLVYPTLRKNERIAAPGVSQIRFQLFLSRAHPRGVVLLGNSHALVRATASADRPSISSALAVVKGQARYAAPYGRPCRSKWQPPCPLQEELFSMFCSLGMTTLNESLCVLTLLSTLAPLHLMLADTPSPRGSDANLSIVGSLSEGFRRFVTLPPYLVGYC